MGINYKRFSDKTHSFEDNSYDRDTFVEKNTDFGAIVEEIKPEEDPTPLGTVNFKEVYVRERPYPDATPVTTVKEGAELMILDLGYTDWYQIMTASGAEGFIMSKFVDIKD